MRERSVKIIKSTNNPAAFSGQILKNKDWPPGPNAKSISVLGKSKSKSYFITDSEP